MQGTDMPYWLWSHPEDNQQESHQTEYDRNDPVIHGSACPQPLSTSFTFAPIVAGLSTT